jgi:hypothetical protein
MIRRPSAGGAAATAPGVGLITGFPAQPSRRLVMGCTAAQACEGAPICGRRLPRSPNRRRRTGSAAKQIQAKPSKIAWFYLVLFVRIGTFQWVTANPNKKIFPYVTLWLNGHKQTGRPSASEIRQWEGI